MIRYILVLAMFSIIPAAYGSCESIEECKFANLFPEPEAKLYLPSESVTVAHGKTAHVLIAGTLPEEKVAKRPILIDITGPDEKTVSLEILSTEQGYFQTLHSITADRHAEGIYKVESWFAETEIDTDEEIISKLAEGEFHVTILGDTADHIVVIVDTAGRACLEDVNTCYENPDAQIVVGNTIQWINEGVEAHHIRATAIGSNDTDMSIVKSALDIGYFDTGVIPPQMSETIQFDTPLSAIYSCMFHPWMEGTIHVAILPDETTDIPETILDVKPESKTPGSSEPRIVFDVENTMYHNAGDTISMSVHYVNTKSSSVSVDLLDSDGIEIADTYASREEDTSTFEIVTQPTWKPGKYTVDVDPRGKTKSSKITITIDTHDIVCVEDAISNITKKQHSKNCYAGIIDKIIDADTLSISKKYISLSVANPGNNDTQRDVSKQFLEETCPPGSIAIVDMDRQMTADSRSLAAERSQGAYSAVYCNHNPTSVNQQMINAGLAEIDPIGCLTSEFEWSTCPVIQEIIETVPTELEPENNCMIALVSYGTDLAYPVQLLREFRGDIITDPFMKAGLDSIHQAYYAVSPHVVDIMNNTPELKTVAYLALYVPISAAGAYLE